MRPGAELDPLRALFGDLVSGGADNGLGAMISAQDTVLSSSAGCSSAWEGRFLRNVPLSTREGRTDVIGLLRGPGPVLLLLGEGGSRYAEQAREWSAALRVVRAAPTAKIPCDALLVRPDGYIAWAADGDALDATLRAYLGPGRRAGSGFAALVSRPRPSDSPAGAVPAVR
jgi:hypothetical protein